MNKLTRFLFVAGSVFAIATSANSQTVSSGFSEEAAIPVPDEGKTYPSYFLTVDQLQKCVSVEDSMGMLSGYIQKRNSIFTTYREELTKLDNQIQKIEAYFKNNPNTKIDDKENFETRNKMVRENNDLAARYNQKLDQYSTLQKAYNSDVEEFNSLSAAFQTDCNGKRYYRDDLKSVRGEK